MYLIAGLGNPEQKYALTRHNVGFEAALSVRKQHDFSIEKNRCHAMVSTGIIGSEKVMVMRPLTYMNCSGIAVAEAASFFKLPPDHIIVLSDDVSIPLGSLRLRRTGSAGGHNGLKSIIEHLGSEDFLRVRIGVGLKPDGWDLADFVLARLTKEEQEKLSGTIEEAAQAAAAIITDGMDKAMNQYNHILKAGET